MKQDAFIARHEPEWGELEEWLERQIPQRLLARYDSVSALAAHLATRR